MAISTTVTLNDLYANIVQAALYTLSEQTVIRPLVRNYNMVGTPGLVAQIPKYAALTAAGVAEGTDLIGTASTFSTDVATITAAEIGVGVELTDIAREGASEDIAAAIGRQMGDALAKKVDTDLAALFSGFSQVVGSGAAELTVDSFFQAAAILRNANAPGPYVAVIHPYQAYQIKKQLTNSGATMSHNLSEVGNTALMDGFVGRLAGIDIFETTVVSGASAGAYEGAVMSADAIGYMLKRDMRIEEERNASKRATEFVGTMAFGVSELFDTYGVKLLGDAQL
tara:strand:- start:4502 stop:5350 length:849 start_codon:yes stop_codon:yes gene_type:complete